MPTERRAYGRVVPNDVLVAMSRGVPHYPNLPIFRNNSYRNIVVYNNTTLWTFISMDQARQVDPLLIPENDWDAQICLYCNQSWRLHEGAACTSGPQSTPTQNVTANTDTEEHSEMPRTMLSNRKFGVEIELTHLNIGTFSAKMRKYNVQFHNALDDGEDADSNSWVLKSDGSVRNQGLELVSPPLSGQDGMSELKLVLGLINSCGGRVDISCGLHVHHSAQGLQENHLKRLFALYKKYEKLLYLIATPARIGSSYCKPRTMSDFNSIITSRNFMSEIKRDRYFGINFCALDRHRTIEFRLLEGTTNEKKIEAWVILTQRLIFKARNGARIIYNPSRGLRHCLNIDLMGRALGLKRTEAESQSFIVLKECYNKHKNTVDGRRVLEHN